MPKKLKWPMRKAPAQTSQQVADQLFSQANGQQLDNAARIAGVVRREGEGDRSFRQRIASAMFNQADPVNAFDAAQLPRRAGVLGVPISPDETHQDVQSRLNAVVHNRRDANAPIIPSLTPEDAAHPMFLPRGPALDVLLTTCGFEREIHETDEEVYARMARVYEINSRDRLRPYALTDEAERMDYLVTIARAGGLDMLGNSLGVRREDVPGAEGPPINGRMLADRNYRDGIRSVLLNYPQRLRNLLGT